MLPQGKMSRGKCSVIGVNLVQEHFLSCPIHPRTSIEESEQPTTAVGNSGDSALGLHAYVRKLPAKSRFLSSFGMTSFKERNDKFLRNTRERRFFGTAV